MNQPGKGMSWKDFLFALQQEWFNDNLGQMAGAVTFSAVLSLFPFLVFLVALASLFVDPAGAASIIESLSRIAPAPVTTLLAHRIRALAAQHSIGLLTFGIVGTIWAASGALTTLMNALNTCYAVRETRPWWKTRGIAVIMTLFGAIFGVIATVAAVALPAIARRYDGIGTVVMALRLPMAAILMMFVWAVLYYVLPDVEQRFRFITPGSVAGVLLWILASWLFSVYVSHFHHYEFTYGALGAGAILLLWMWISAQVLLLGAEINAILEHWSPEGKRVGARDMSDIGEDVNKTAKALREARDRESQSLAPGLSTRVRRKAKDALLAVALGRLLRLLSGRPRSARRQS
jgi:membrane protein